MLRGPRLNELLLYSVFKLIKVVEKVRLLRVVDFELLIGLFECIFSLRVGNLGPALYEGVSELLILFLEIVVT